MQMWTYVSLTTVVLRDLNLYLCISWMASLLRWIFQQLLGYQLESIHTDVQENHYYLTILLLWLLSGASYPERMPLWKSRAFSTKLNCESIRVSQDWFHEVNTHVKSLVQHWVIRLFTCFTRVWWEDQHCHVWTQSYSQLVISQA